MNVARPMLLPLIPLYRMGLAARELRLRRGWEAVRRLRDPVVSIGNLSAGGSGKTPLTIALAQALSGRGLAVDVLSRGYGRRGSGGEGVLVADPAGGADRYGDEPLLIARNAGVPVYVARQRYAAGRLAEAERERAQDRGASGPKEERVEPAEERMSPPRIHLLDDGFQHRQLARDVDIVLLSRSDWEDRLLPGGNLREPIEAVRRASILAIPGEDRGFEGELRAWGWKGPVWRVRRRMEVPEVEGPAVAFCGIAKPRQFFVGLEKAGVSLAVGISYPDHHRFTERNLESIALAARSHRARALITTEKDAVRLGALSGLLPSDVPLRVARLTIEIENEALAVDRLLERLKLTPPRRGL